MEEVDDRFGVAVAAYETWLERQPLAASTKREYRRWVRAFMAVDTVRTLTSSLGMVVEFGREARRERAVGLVEGHPVGNFGPALVTTVLTSRRPVLVTVASWKVVLLMQTWPGLTVITPPSVLMMRGSAPLSSPMTVATFALASYVHVGAALAMAGTAPIAVPASAAPSAARRRARRGEWI